MSFVPLRNRTRAIVAWNAANFQRQPLCRQTPRLFTSSCPRMATPPNAEQQQASKGGKLKGFFKKYGAVGAGVYITLSVIDLSLTTAVISVKGADKAKQMEDYILHKVKGWIGMEHKTEPAAISTKEKPSFTSLFLIAYGIHKTILLPVRLSLTAAITPTIARRLRELGWKKL